MTRCLEEILNHFRDEEKVRAQKNLKKKKKNHNTQGRQEFEKLSKWRAQYNLYFHYCQVLFPGQLQHQMDLNEKKMQL